jgi:Na+-transporting NADH:ubiquinone oxidoreductase subunit C
LAYRKYIKAEYVFDANGNEIGKDAFNIDIAVTKDKFPVFVTEKDGKKFYVIPVRGVGLWDAIWGYVSINEQLIVDGIVFDHKAETPGLGAEIREDFFTQRFIGESIFDKNDVLQAVKVVKGYTGGENKEDGQVDAISGATLTCNGVTNMLAAGLKPYEKFLKSNKK